METQGESRVRWIGDESSQVSNKQGGPEILITAQGRYIFLRMLGLPPSQKRLCQAVYGNIEKNIRIILFLAV